MCNKIKSFLICLFFVISYLHADYPSEKNDDQVISEIPTPFINSVNVITGQYQGFVTPSIEIEYYKVGMNQVGDTKIHLSKEDSRIGKVRLQKTQKNDGSWQVSCRFFYFPDHTDVFDSLNRKSSYYFNQLYLTAVEHYSLSTNQTSHLYRKERLFWNSEPIPQLTSRVLEDGQGRATTCCVFTYSKIGQLTQEAVFGNLSGLCTNELVIQNNGFPLENGIEHYCVRYQYDQKNPELMISRQEDNGLHTIYQYDSQSNKLSAKFLGDEEGIKERYFYFYDEKDFINKTISDDGQSLDWQNLQGVHVRQIVYVQSSYQKESYGSPLLTEKKYTDLVTGQEILIEKVSYEYSNKGKLIQQAFYDANGSLRYDLKMFYDQNDCLIETIDSRGKIAEVDRPLLTPYELNERGQPVKVTDRYGNQTQYVYDEFGRLVKTIFPLVLDAKNQPIHPTTSQEYDLHNRVIKQHDANHRSTEIQYNIRGQPTKILYPDQSTEFFIYNLDGSLLEKIARNGIKTIFKRDAFGKVIKVEEQTSSGVTFNTLAYTYQGDRPVSLTDEKTFTLRLNYDDAGRPIRYLKETKDGVQKTEWMYDECGQKTQSKQWFGKDDSDFIIKLEKQDIWQNLLGIDFKDGKGELQEQLKIPQKDEPSFIFVKDGMIINDREQYVKQQELIDGYGTLKLITYDALNRVEHVIKKDPFGNTIQDCQYRYDANGNKTLEKHLVLVKGQTTRSYEIVFNYDELNRLIEIVEAAGSSHQKKTSQIYSQQGQLTTTIKPDGTVLNYEYDQQNRLIAFTASDQSIDYCYSYDEKSRLVAVEDNIHNRLITRHYNDLNQLIQESQGAEGFNCYQYDLADRCTQLTLPDQSSIVYEYEGLLLKTITRYSAQHELLYQHHYDYDSETKKLVGVDLIGQVGQINYSHHNEGQLQSLHSPYWSQTIPADGFDASQHLTQFSITDPVESFTSHFDYSLDDQLILETGEFQSSYEYDSLYNRIKTNHDAWEINSFNQLQATPFAYYDYDINGNLIQKRENSINWSYHYDALNRLTRVEKENSLAVEYEYDAFHRRLAKHIYEWNTEQKTWKILTTDYFLYDQDKEIGQFNAEQQLIKLRVLGIGKGAEIGSAVALEINQHVYAPIHDYQGSVRCLIDVETKQVAEFYRYSVYGIEKIFDQEGQIQEQSLVDNPWRFSSKRKDEETGLIYFGKRYYDSQIGRWITPDPLFYYDSANVYAFVKNDPLTQCDLYGLFSISSIWNQFSNMAYNCFSYFYKQANQFPHNLFEELELSETTRKSFKKAFQEFLGESFFLLMGYNIEERHSGVYGKGELNDKIRLTFIHGILTTRQQLMENLELISNSHGGINVHYIFRPTEGWMWDITRAKFIKIGYLFGFRSSYAHLLADHWKGLINDMGGVKSGGTIIHYAHSLGGTDTDRARELLTPEEQKMIKVYSFGSATMIRNRGFSNVMNYVSLGDGVSYLDPLGRIRCLFDPNCNITFHSKFLRWIPLCDHPLNVAYKSIVEELGEKFIQEFNQNQGL